MEQAVLRCRIFRRRAFGSIVSSCKSMDTLLKHRYYSKLRDLYWPFIVNSKASCQSTFNIVTFNTVKFSFVIKISRVRSKLKN